MESQFWGVLETHPFFVVIIIIGGLFILSQILNARSKIHDLLGYKTKSEVDKHDYEQKELKRDEQMNELWQEIKEMREEARKSYEGTKASLKLLEEDIRNVKRADIMILGDRISQKSAYYLRAGSIPPDEIKEFEAMYDAYKKIDGNHGVDTLYEKTIAALPLSITQEKEEYEE